MLDDALGGQALAKLPATDDESATQVRLNLHYEPTGFDNRLATERERYEAAQRRQLALARKPGVRLARMLGAGP